MMFLQFIFYILAAIFRSNILDTSCDSLLTGTKFFSSENVRQCRIRVEHNDIYERIRRECLIKSDKTASATTKWQRFKTQFMKSYANSTVEFFRCISFQDSLRRTEIHNQRYKAGKESYYLKITEYADLTDEEFRIIYLGPGGYSRVEATDIPQFLNHTPTTLDWRNRGYVTDVRNQGACGSCWAFGAVAALEAQYVKRHGVQKNFSEQQLVDCVYLYRSGCRGGSPIYAFWYIMQNGITSLENYPYTGKNGTCKYKATMLETEMKRFYTLPPWDETLMKRALATVGPLTVAFYMPPPMRLYGGGVYDRQLCPRGKSNHVVLVIGYGTTKEKKDYWLIKNSFGAQWGDAGYFQLPRGVGFCAISHYVIFPEIP